MMFLLIQLALAVPDCAEEIRPLTVVGSSLRGRVPEGSSVHVALGAEACWSPARGDVVMLVPGRGKDTALKVIRAVPGDVVGVVPEDDGLLLQVNGVTLRAATGGPFLFRRGRARMIQRLTGVVPTDAYVVLGEVPGGSKDSSRFGFLHRTAIVGPVVAIESPPLER